MERIKFGAAYKDFEFDVECSEEFMLTVLRGIKDMKVNPDVVIEMVRGIRQFFIGMAEESKRADTK